MSKNNYTITQFQKEFPNEEACLEKLFQLRYGRLEACPCCNQKTRFDRIRTRPAYQCAKCYAQFYPCAGTIFHRTRVPLLNWFFAMFVFSHSKNGVSAYEIQRQIGGSYKTSLRVLKKIRELAAKDSVEYFVGAVEMDETLVGGKNKNRHRDKKYKNCQGRSCVDKTPVFGMYHRESGKVIGVVTRDTSKKSIQPLIFEHIEVGSRIYTDEWKAYNGLDGLYIRNFVNHRLGQYGDGENTSNRIENFWSVFKRTVKGSYIQVRPENLQSYVDEVTFKFNNRNSDEPIFCRLLGLVA